MCLWKRKNAVASDNPSYWHPEWSSSHLLVALAKRQQPLWIPPSIRKTSVPLMSLHCKEFDLYTCIHFRQTKVREDHTSIKPSRRMLH